MFDALKKQIREGQIRAQRTVNTQLTELYWSIGSEILRQQEREGWGTRVIGRLADDLRAEFPAMKGFSPSNLQYMPWGHITTLLDKFDDRKTRDWYATTAFENGWTRNVLLNQIMNRTLERSGPSPNNFASRLPAEDPDLVRQIEKDP